MSKLVLFMCLCFRLADGLRQPLLVPRAAAARRGLSPLAVQQPPNEPFYEPPRPNSVLVSSAGLATTIFISASALSAAGRRATWAAGAAALFTFKLSKELSERGVNKRTFSRAAVDTVQLGVRAAVSAGLGVAYFLASGVSLVVWALTRVGESVLYAAELTARLKPGGDGNGLPFGGGQGEVYGGGYPLVDRRDAYGGDAPRASRARAASPVAPPATTSPAAVRTSRDVEPGAAGAARAGGYARVAQGGEEGEGGPTDFREAGRQLAVAQMLKRSAMASAAAKEVELAQGAILRAKQENAVRQVFAARRQAEAEGALGQASHSPLVTAFLIGQPSQPASSRRAIAVSPPCRPLSPPPS